MVSLEVKAAGRGVEAEVPGGLHVVRAALVDRCQHAAVEAVTTALGRSRGSAQHSFDSFGLLCGEFRSGVHQVLDRRSIRVHEVTLLNQP